MTKQASTSTQSCPHARSCVLFPILQKSNALDYWSRTYCEGDFGRCARFERLTKGLAVAPNLLPNGKKI